MKPINTKDASLKIIAVIFAWFMVRYIKKNVEKTARGVFMKNKCTLKDVAKACGVSAYTVSRAINGKKDISDATRERILETAKKIGYVPNTTARLLKSGRSYNIAIVYDDLENPYYNMVLSKIVRRLDETDYHTTLFYDEKSKSVLNLELMSKILATNVEAIISFIAVSKEACKLNEIWKKPIVVLTHIVPGTNIDYFCFDDLYGGFKLTEHFIKKGASRIGFINATTKLKSGMLRYEGYLQALKSYGYEMNEEVVYHLEDRNIPLETAVTELLYLHEVEAIACFNDLVALTVLKKIHLDGQNAHKKVLVGGFDNIQASIPIPFNMTTIFGDVDEIVDKSVRHILERLKGLEKEVIQEVLPVKLHIGE